MFRLLAGGARTRFIRHSSSLAQFPTGQSTSKPTLGQFKWPIANTLLIAATTAAILNAVYYKLEADERETALLEKAALLEQRIQQLVDEKKQVVAEESAHKNKSWWKFW
ncbi:hypothetical protein JNB11_07540 [Kocuria palustris]|nr:hypothetical protein [Kocuria palustris]